MKFTTVDLYRIGSLAAADMAVVRPNIDVTLYQNNGATWVCGTPQGGSSTTAKPWKLRLLTNRWWHLPIGTPYDDRLNIRNDHGQHWLWEAVADMPYADYLAMLV
jgi:hypothetical protein